ncbi:uncharacterized protein LOC131687124 [Topomyia yanbarensis]|uniref:uncharacterized protein LOC131687124 n=1 Tax=Topomyia yanbarensis TaxID=2498891 RepID=UPI00273B48A2|nr:uncharacterized protein LOC131687124 [Topomyia yanbarensis]
MLEVQGYFVAFLQYLVLTYFSRDSYCTVIYYDRQMTDADKECDQYCLMLQAVELAFGQLNDDQPAVMWISAESDTEEMHLENAIEYGCQSYIVISQRVMEFLQTKLTVKERTLQRIRDRNFLIYSENKALLDNSSITTTALKFFPNLWFLVPSSNTSYDFYTQQNWNEVPSKIILADSYDIVERKFTGDGNLYLDKLFDLQGTTINMGVTDYAPYCVTKNVGANQGNADAFNSSVPKELFIDGLEGSLIVEFCKNRNCNIKLWPYGPSDWGEIYPNGSGYGEIYSTYTKQTEFSICCLYYTWFRSMLDASQYIAKSTITVLVPGAKLLPTTLTLTYPFSKIVWFSIFLMLVIMTVVHHMITTINLKQSFNRDTPQPPIEKSIFDMISIYLDQGIFPNSASSSYRVLISFILLSGVVLSNSYASGLASVLTIPRYGKSIENIHDFVESSYRWAAPAWAWVLSLYAADTYDIRQVVNRFDMIPDEDEIFRRTQAGDYGVGVELLNGGNYAYGASVREENVHLFDIMKEELYFSYTIAYSQRGWPLMEYFNKFNLEAVQHGFIIYWEGQTIRKYMSNRMEHALALVSEGHNDKEEIKPLSVQHILGPSFVLLVGLTAATVMFICELMWKALHVSIGQLLRKAKLATKRRASGLLQTTNTNFSGAIMIQDQAELVAFFQYLVLTYFSGDSYCTVIYYDRKSYECDQYCSVLLVVEQALAQLKNSQIPVVWIASESDTEGKHLTNAVEIGCQSYLVVTRKVMDFFKLKLTLKEKTMQKARDRKILIYSENITFLDSSSIASNALKFYPNLWFIVGSGNDKYDFYTQHYWNGSPSDIRIADSYDIAESKFIGGGNLFYDKMYDLHGTTVNLGVTDYAPYCITTNVGVNQGNVDAYNSSLPKELFLEGFEGSLVVEFCEMRNCSIRLWPYGSSNWGNIFHNGSGYGLIYSTYIKETEFAICSLYYNWHFQFLDSSQYIAKSSITTLVPGAKLLPTSLTLTYPFTNIVWFSIFIMMVIMTVVHHMITSLNLQHRETFQPPIEKSIFDMISIYLDQGIFPNSVSSSYRVLLSFILLSGVILSNSYSSGLACVLTIPRYGKSIETIHDLAQSPYRWGAPDWAWVFSLLEVDSADIRQVVAKFDMIPDEEKIYQRTLPGDFGVAVEVLNGGNYAYGSYVREQNVHRFDILKEELYFSYSSAYSQRGWPLMEYFNKFSLEAIQHGFIIYWERRTIRKYMGYRMGHALSRMAEGHNEKEELKSLSLQHIVGPMFVIVIGSTIAMAMFICELIWYSLCKKYTQKIHCPES